MFAVRKLWLVLQLDAAFYFPLPHVRSFEGPWVSEPSVGRPLSNVELTAICLLLDRLQRVFVLAQMGIGSAHLIYK